MEIKNTKATGSIKISEDVIETIVKTVLNETDGVHSLATPSVSAAEMMIKNVTLKPINVTLSADSAAIDININLDYGVKVKPVAETIQERVKDTVQDMTGVAVNKVNVYIAGAKAKDEK